MRHLSVAACCLILACGAARAQTPVLPREAPAPFSPDPTQTAPSPTDTWIFSGALIDSNETFSGTLVTGKDSAAFELRLGGGATCDGGDLQPDVGLVRLSDIVCSDDRVLRALFVPQDGATLKVFGHVGDERFATVAHLLGTEAVPEKARTAAPHAPPEPPGPSQTPSRPPPG